LIGPYPYNPYLIFLFFFALFFSRFVPLISFLPAGPERWRAGGIIIVASAVPGLIFCAGSIMLNKFRFWSSESTLLYVLEVAFFQYLNLLYLPFINRRLKAQLGHSNETLIALSPNIFIVSLILVLIALALMHQAERKISDRLNLATKLVTKLESEREGLIYSDERLRRQTSQFLHDRVQSDLMVVGMKLKSISGQSTAEINEVIEKAISRLEETRSSDLRNLIQILTPNLEAGNLHSALDLLFEQYRTSMDIVLHIDEAVEELDSELLLGIFRIVEQSILNSLVHGPASRVQVDVRSAAGGALELTIADDGPGTSIDGINVGVGTAIIDSWVDILKGVKEVDSAPGHGYQLQVLIPAR
jgi:signal transduction histidine kinase